MIIRATGALLCALGFLCASPVLVAAKDGTPKASGASPAGTVSAWHEFENNRKNPRAGSSKSNTSDRMGGGGGKGKPDCAAFQVLNTGALGRCQ
jgi:hypothetical protein